MQLICSWVKKKYNEHVLALQWYWDYISRCGNATGKQQKRFKVLILQGFIVLKTLIIIVKRNSRSSFMGGLFLFEIRKVNLLYA